MKTFLKIFITLSICVLIISKWTNGFKDFSVYSYTLDKANKLDNNFPKLQIINQDSTLITVDKLNKFVLINFIYLNCPSVCQKMNGKIGVLYDSLKKYVPHKIKLLTVSFDTKNDNLQKIRRYRSNRFGSNLEDWDFALPYNIDSLSLRKKLKRLGIWIYKIPRTNLFNHSVYFYLLSPKGKIIKIFNPTRESNETILSSITKCIKQKK